MPHYCSVVFRVVKLTFILAQTEHQFHFSSSLQKLLLTTVCLIPSEITWGKRINHKAHSGCWIVPWGEMSLWMSGNGLVCL